VVPDLIGADKNHTTYTATSASNQRVAAQRTRLWEWSSEAEMSFQQELGEIPQSIFADTNI